MRLHGSERQRSQVIDRPPLGSRCIQHAAPRSGSRDRRSACVYADQSFAPSRCWCCCVRNTHCVCDPSCCRCRCCIDRCFLFQRAARCARHSGVGRDALDCASYIGASRSRPHVLSSRDGEATRVSTVTAAAKPRGTLDVLRDYLSLFKLRIVALLDATAIGVMIPAAHGHPRLEVVLAVLAGGTLAAGGAHAVNCWFDRDIDAEMTRTRRRPIPGGRIPPWHALAIGIGGAAGAIPPLVGWAAVTGRLDLTALALFAVIFFWTPPHFWALAQLMKADYARARIPMLPVVAGERSAKRQSVIYAVLTAVVSVIPFFTGSAGAIYLGGAIVLGAGLVAITLLDLRGRRWTRRLFTYSLVYVALLFGLFAVSPFLP